MYLLLWVGILAGNKRAVHSKMLTEESLRKKSLRGSLKETYKRWWNTQALQTRESIYTLALKDRSKRGINVTGTQHKLLLGEGAPARSVVLRRDNTITEKNLVATSLSSHPVITCHYLLLAKSNQKLEDKGCQRLQNIELGPRARQRRVEKSLHT